MSEEIKEEKLKKTKKTEEIDKNLTIGEILSKIQVELKAPKSKYNKFGQYHYRSCEDILDGIKTLLDKYGVYILLNDNIEIFGDRYYVKATATLVKGENSISTSAYARESLDKKGMDSSQVTGATSSYARKYALNGLLAIDDTKDADTMDNGTKYATVDQIKTLSMLVSDINAVCKHYGVSKPEQLTDKQITEAINIKRGK